jgi:hypothetical protein
MLKRLLKTSAIKNVLSGAGGGIGGVVNNGNGGLNNGPQQHHHHQQRSHLFDFAAAELGQPPPGIP